jgi:hypothetical protein
VLVVALHVELEDEASVCKLERLKMSSDPPDVPHIAYQLLGGDGEHGQEHADGDEPGSGEAAGYREVDDDGRALLVGTVVLNRLLPGVPPRWSGGIVHTAACVGERGVVGRGDGRGGSTRGGGGRRELAWLFHGGRYRVGCWWWVLVP